MLRALGELGLKRSIGKWTGVKTLRVCMYVYIYIYIWNRVWVVLGPSIIP